MNTVGILTSNDEFIRDFEKNSPSYKFIHYKTIDSAGREEYSCLLIDADIFDDLDSLQFFLSRIRKKILKVPVLLILKAADMEEFDPDWFIDDFALYPFRKNEISGRIKRLIHQNISDDDNIVIGNFRINTRDYSIYLNNEKLQLTYKEFEILRLLAQNRGKVFSRKELLNTIWGVEFIGGTRTVDVHVRRLRGKLGDEFNEIIETVRNVGYKCKE